MNIFKTICQYSFRFIEETWKFTNNCKRWHPHRKNFHKHYQCHLSTNLWDAQLQVQVKPLAIRDSDCTSVNLCSRTVWQFKFNLYLLSICNKYVICIKLKYKNSINNLIVFKNSLVIKSKLPSGRLGLRASPLLFISFYILIKIRNSSFKYIKNMDKQL